MRLPRVRFTIRTLLIVVAVSGTLLGVGIGAARLKSRSDYYSSRATDFATKEALYAKYVKELEAMAADVERVTAEYSNEAKRRSGLERVVLVATSRLLLDGQTERAKTNVNRCQHIVDYYSTMKTRYQVAASHPWRSVPPDPPPP